MSENCPLCGGVALFVFVERSGVPVHQNVALSTAQAARAFPRGDLRLACCRTCGFVTNLAFQPELLQYGEGYENDQLHSAAFDDHVGGLVTSLVEGGVREQFVVEVGCGQGQFLRRLCAAGRNEGMGFDPAYTGPEVTDGGTVRFAREFYGTRRADRAPDLVVCRHVIEHVPAPLELLERVRVAIGDRRSRVAFETPTVSWILDGGVVQDFFYEHCSYFTPESLRFAFERTGFTNFSARAVFGGQYTWATAEHVPGQPAPGVRSRPDDVLDKAARYREYEVARTRTLTQRLERLVESGPVAVWGAGAKGVTFLNLLDPECHLVDCAVDMNPKKQGRFVPGTGHVIVSQREVVPRDIRHIVVMNPNYSDEIRTLVQSMGARAEIHNEGDL